VYTGYFTVPTIGTYSIGFVNATTDDATYIWLGTTPQSGSWSEYNYNARNTYQTPNTTGITHTFTASQLYPVTVLYANAIRSANMGINIKPLAGAATANTAG
jgi:hypothetical protein